jgi:hypothetical protein
MKLYIIFPTFLNSKKNIQCLRYKIWDFRGGDDYEECRPLGYKIPVHTSQEIHYVCATEPRRLKLCKIWSFHGGDYEGSRLMGCDAVWLCKNRRYGWMYRLHLKCENSSFLFAAFFSCYLLLTFLPCWFCSPWWWGHYVPPKRRFLQEPHILHSLCNYLAVFVSTCVPPTPALECHNQYFSNLDHRWRHLSTSERRISQIPPIGQCLSIYSLIVARLEAR